MLAIVGVGVYLRRRTLQNVPLWLDEAWVADSVKTSPFRNLWMAFPGPPLWQASLRVVYYGSHIERLRIVPFLFNIGCIAPAYLIGRRIGRLQALVCAGMVALLPWAVYRQDLKQYTAETFVALFLVYAGTRIESAWRVRGLAVYAVIATLIVLFAETSIFVNAAVFAGLGLGLALQRRWRRLGTLAAVGAVVLVLDVALLKWLQSQGSRTSLERYWDGSFITTNKGLSTALRFTDHRIRGALEGIGFAWWIAVPLVLLGMVVLWRRGMRVASLAGPLVLAAMIVGASRRLYPLLDKRTSLFLVALFAVDVAVGIGWILGVLLRRRATWVVALAVVVAAGWSIWPAAARESKPSVPFEDVRDQVRYLQSRRGPHDVILLGYAASYGFAAYDPEPPTFVRSQRPETTLAFLVTYPGDPSIVAAPWRSPADEQGAFRVALSRAREAHGRLWLLLSHDRPDDWAALFPTDVVVQRITTLHLGGGDALFLLTPRSS